VLRRADDIRPFCYRNRRLAGGGLYTADLPFALRCVEKRLYIVTPPVVEFSPFNRWYVEKRLCKVYNYR